MKILEIITESKTQKAKAPKPPNFVAKHAMKTTSGAGAHTNAKKAAKDVRGQKHKAMAEGIVDVVKKKVSGLTGYKVKVSPDDQVWIAGTTTGYFTGSNSREREQQTLEKLSNELKKQGINTSGIKYTDMHDFTGDKYPPAWFIKVVKGQAETVLDMLKNNKIPGFAAASPSLSYPSGKSPTYRHSQDGLGGNPKESRKQGVTEAPDQSTAISQEQLNQMYAKAKPMMFIKNTPVALVPLAKINQIGTPQQVQQVQKALGSVDQTSYTDEYKNKGYVVFQWNGTALDLYVASPEVVAQKYVKFNGQLPQDDKSRGKIPSLIALGKLGIDPSKVPFFVKKVPTQMVSAKQLGLEGKTIQTSWGEQTVSPGGFMVREENGHIYTVAPDAQGLPIGYLRVQESVGEGFGGNDTVQSLVNIRSTVKQIQTGKAQYPQGFASQLEIALYDAINALRDNPEQGARNTVNELAELRAIAKQVQTGKATFPQGYTSRLEWVLYDAIKQIENSSQRVAEGRIDEINWKKAAATGAMALGAMGALGSAGSAHARVSLGADGQMSPSAAQQMAQQGFQASAEKSGGQMPNQNVDTAEKVERSDTGIVVHHGGKEYKGMLVPKDGPTPRGAKMIKIQQSQMGEKGIGNYTTYLLPNGTAYIYKLASQSANEGVAEGVDDTAYGRHQRYFPKGDVYNSKGKKIGVWNNGLILDPTIEKRWEDENGYEWVDEIKRLASDYIAQGRWTVAPEQGVAEGRIDEKAKSKAQQKFMGMVYAAKKGEKPASPEVAKAAIGMSKKSAKDYAQTKHKGKPEHVKEDGEGGASAGSTTSAMMNIGAVYKNKRAKKQKPGTNALDMKGVNLLTGGSIKR